MWEKKLYELGISEKELPSAVKTKIKQYRTLSNGINELEDKINDAAEDEDISEINVELEEYQEALDLIDEKIEEQIDAFESKNRDRYEAAQPKPKPKLELEPKPELEPEPKPQYIPPPVPQIVQQAKVSANGEKGKSNNSVGWFIFAAVAGIVTLGAVNVFKRK